MDTDNFKDLLMQSEDAWVVWYQHDEGETMDDPQWQSLMQKAEGVVFAATIECKEQPELCASQATPGT